MYQIEVEGAQCQHLQVKIDKSSLFINSSYNFINVQSEANAYKQKEGFGAY